MIINPWASLISQVDQDPLRSAKSREDARLNGKGGNNSAGVAASWLDPKTRGARCAREGVEVTLPSGELRPYLSLRKAFEGLRLPMGKHAMFRLKLKAARRLKFEDDGKAYVFRIVPRA
ncbi:hypothetical protein [Burkholderia ubonensis]|uniref:hypothetical protein n=1 Tax=Burkholderia ubonensis TaxID=101571 RepID=UPI00076D8D42|nr:hypothetical protein [Burkholderia ubonensis]KVU77510.1 hypothetical protein WK74_27420 [Burkholderia ubonensis]